jgi:heme exporter protein A
MDGALLRITDLRHAFGARRILDGVSCEVAAGGLLQVVGPNGAGKSTLLRCVAGLLRPRAGSIECFEHDRRLEVEERRRRVGYVAPDVELYAELSARENLEFFATLRCVERPRGAALLDALGVPAATLWSALSSGQRQRARWALALLGSPRILLLDEPFEHLDRDGLERARSQLASHLAAGGLALVAAPEPISELRGATLRLDAHA